MINSSNTAVNIQNLKNLQNPGQSAAYTAGVQSPFGSNPPTFSAQPTTDEVNLSSKGELEEPEKKTNWWLIGGLAVAAIAGAVVAHKAGWFDSLFSKADAAAKAVKEEICKTTFDDFKSAGNKFEKGLAVTKDGEKFTGKFKLNPNKSGNYSVLEYENGLLKSKYFYSSGELKDTLSGTKVFERDSNGVLTKVTNDRYAKLEKEFENGRLKLMRDAWADSVTEYVRDDKGSLLKSIETKNSYKSEIEIKSTNGKTVTYIDATVKTKEYSGGKITKYTQEKISDKISEIPEFNKKHRVVVKEKDYVDGRKTKTVIRDDSTGEDKYIIEYVRSDGKNLSERIYKYADGTLAATEKIMPDPKNPGRLKIEFIRPDGTKDIYEGQLPGKQGKDPKRVKWLEDIFKRQSGNS